MQKNSFRYLPPAPGAELWGMTITGAGFCKCLPAAAYPPERHPADHMYEWQQGRVLPVFQILGIIEGCGELESSNQPAQRLVADSAILIKPGQWHRYRPDPATGWTEIWIEFLGSVPKALGEAGQLGEGLIVTTGATNAGLWGALDGVLQRVRSSLPGVAPELSALGMEALAAWNRLCLPNAPSPDVDQALATAIEHLNLKYCDPVDLEALAQKVGMSYSAFRRSFRNITGFAPWKYVQHMRLAHARHRLATSSDSLAELANKLGFSSAFHLSTAFRKEFNISPMQWKKIAKKRTHSSAAKKGSKPKLIAPSKTLFEPPDDYTKMHLRGAHNLYILNQFVDSSAFSDLVCSTPQ
jgi:AraC-like DNA-binding protein